VFLTDFFAARIASSIILLHRLRPYQRRPQLHLNRNRTTRTGANISTAIPIRRNPPRKML
jgi:hypothetical protein